MTENVTLQPMQPIAVITCAAVEDIKRSQSSAQSVVIVNIIGVVMLLAIVVNLEKRSTFACNKKSILLVYVTTRKNKIQVHQALSTFWAAILHGARAAIQLITHTRNKQIFDESNNLILSQTINFL